MPRAAIALIFAGLVATGSFETANAQTVWSGLTFTFTKTASSDHTLPANQDALTDNVVFTRPGSGGLINFAQESSYAHFVSPVDTRWATDINNPDGTIAAANWENLEFTSWIEAYGGQFSAGAFIPNRDAVVHLISDDIYLDLRFTSWTPSTGGGFTYMRAEPADVAETTGDYNLDGQVDAADYVMWRKTFGQSVSPNGSGADGDADGMIDEGDYEFWRQRFGESAPGSGGAVPEPAGVSVVMIAVCWGSSMRRRTKR